MIKYDLIIIGAGIAGMTAAIGAARQGIKDILIIEREAHLGGILNQLIHNGFGEKFIGAKITGPEYIDFLKNEMENLNIKMMLNSSVLEVSGEKLVTYVNPTDGVTEVRARSIIFAMGAREKFNGNVMISTNGLTGIFTLGEGHCQVNLEGYLPGGYTIITGTNKWAFLVARRLIIEGGKVEGVILEKSFDEVVDDDIKDIIEGFNIPIIENSKIVQVDGKVRVESVKILNTKDNTVIEKQCDSLLLSVGFVPDTSIIKKLKLDINKSTEGPAVNHYKTSKDGFFACGSILYGESIFKMDEVDGLDCGIKAAKYIQKYMY